MQRRGVHVGAALLVALGLLSAPADAGPGAPVRLTIAHTNDLHGHVENCAAIAALVRETRAKNPNTLFLDAGDAISGTPVSTVFRGEPVFEVMTLMGYDAATLGNHEFDHGWRQIAKFRALAAHPLLNANVTDPEGAPVGDEPWHVFTVGGVRIGVLGLLTESVPTMTTKANWEGCKVEPPLETAKRLVPEVRRQCDVVVLLTHAGVEMDAAIAGAVPGIDLVVGGHSHTELREPILVACRGRDVPVVQAHVNGDCVGIVDFEWDPATRTARSFRGRLVRVDAATMPNAPDVKRLVDQWTARTEERQAASGKAPLSEVIGRAAEKLSRDRLCAAIERIYADVLDADFGFQNLFGVRADVAAGDIRVEDVWKVLPFENTLVKIRLRGDQVPAYAKKRLGAKFDPEREYVFATNSYVGDQQRKYLRVEGVAVEDTGLAMRDAVVAWVKEHGGFGDTSEAAGHGEDAGEKK